MLAVFEKMQLPTFNIIVDNGQSLLVYLDFKLSKKYDISITETL